MDTSLEIKTLNCIIQGHDETPIIGLCIDDNCTDKNKFLCSDCFFDVHFGHKAIKIKELNNLIQTRNNDYKQYYEEEQKILGIYNEHELNQKEKVYKLKRDIINKMEKNIDNFFEGLNKKCNELKNKNIRDFESFKEYKNFCKNNVSISDQDLDLCKMAELCLNIRKEINEEKEKEKEKEMVKGVNGEQEILQIENIEKINNELEQLNKNINNYIENQSSSITNYISENFLKMSKYVFNNKRNFEWCNKIYYTYGFYYELSNNNSKAKKVQKDTWWSILRSKEKLENNFIYKIKCKIGLSKGGGFDIGIGREQTGNYYNLQNKESLCISTTGIMDSGNSIGTCHLKDNDIVDIEICTKIGNKTFKGSINNKFICSIIFNLDDIYIMASMKSISNYIEVLEYYVIPL